MLILGSSVALLILDFDFTGVFIDFSGFVLSWKSDLVVNNKLLILIENVD